MVHSSPVQTDHFLSCLRAARNRVRPTKGSVLDAMLQAEFGVEQLKTLMFDCTGVVALHTDEPVVPDWTALPLTLARQYGALALRRGSDEGLLVALADPWDDVVAIRVAACMGRWPRFAAATAELLAAHLGSAEEPGTPSTPARGTASVVDFVDHAIRRALDCGASDVHFESDRAGVALKLRQDGVMVALSRLEGHLQAEQVISRIKVMALLDITERRLPQDGRIRWQQADRSVDLRVSIMPSIHGEDAVLRLLDRAQLTSTHAAMSLDLLGLGGPRADLLRALAGLPHGMLLVTGPTGSGKTTTVYAALSEVNSGLEKIITIEDPVEYELPGVLQIPVNERKGLTFAKGLRSILRHDPDRILVGEIRDAETAEIAVQSALTGHQVFTTVHANSIYDVMGRFRHFGLDMFGFVSSLNGVVVQRLLRRLCLRCVGRRGATPKEVAWFAEVGFAIQQVPEARGCAHCQNTGFRGRGAIAEVHVVDDAIRDLVTSQAPVSALRERVERGESPTLVRQGAQLVIDGVTSIQEVRRVIGWL